MKKVKLVTTPGGCQTRKAVARACLPVSMAEYRSPSGRERSRGAINNARPSVPLSVMRKRRGSESLKAGKTRRGAAGEDVSSD